MAEFASHPVESPGQLSVHKNAGTNALGNGYDDQIADGFRVPEPHFREHTSVGCVFELDPHSGCLLDRRLEIKIGPKTTRCVSRSNRPGKLIPTPSKTKSR